MGICSTLSAGERGRALIEKMRDALFEILALQARQHFTLGYIESLAQRLEHRVVNLPFHDARGTRTGIRGDLARVPFTFARNTSCART